MVKIAFFDTKNYDKEVFNKYNKEYKYDITYFESKLNSETAPLTKGFDVVCIFVNDKADAKTLKILEELGYSLEETGTYFYKDVIVKAVEQLQESSSEESYQELIEDLNNDYSQFYFDIARNGYDVGLKTFHSCINISHQTKNPQDTVLQQRIGIKDANRNYRQEGLLIADYITENQTRKEMTQVKQKAMNY